MAIQFEPVDVTSNTAYYVQVIDALRRKLDSGELQPGNQLPSEAELCAMFRVSRTVVRQALMKLENEGLVTKRKGKGKAKSPARLAADQAFAEAAQAAANTGSDGASTRSAS